MHRSSAAGCRAATGTPGTGGHGAPSAPAASDPARRRGRRTCGGAPTDDRAGSAPAAETRSLSAQTASPKRFAHPSVANLDNGGRHVTRRAPGHRHRADRGRHLPRAQGRLRHRRRDPRRAGRRGSDPPIGRLPRARGAADLRGGDRVAAVGPAVLRTPAGRAASAPRVPGTGAHRSEHARRPAVSHSGPADGSLLRARPETHRAPRGRGERDRRGSRLQVLR